MEENEERIKPAVYLVREVALLTGISEWMVYEQARKGEIPGALRFGKSLRFIKSVVNDWLRIRPEGETDTGPAA